jgi:hypothetical protein
MFEGFIYINGKKTSAGKIILIFKKILNESFLMLDKIYIISKIFTRFIKFGEKLVSRVI